MLEEFGHFIKDQVEVNCEHNCGKKAKNLWDTFRHMAGDTDKVARNIARTSGRLGISKQH